MARLGAFSRRALRGASDGGALSTRLFLSRRTNSVAGLRASAPMSSKLELRWPRKGEHVLQNPASGKREFCGNAPLPFCPLIDLEAYGSEQQEQCAGEQSNLLIKGENLFALQALQRTHAGSVKLIYIDPPFNTGNDFEAYDDNFQHSVWASMMRERLEIMRELLREDGVIFVQIDFNEVGYLRVILDEVFGRDNFITMISWQRAPERTVLGQGQTPIITILEYILAYARHNPAAKSKLNRIKKRIKATREVMSQYRTIVQYTPENKELVWEFENETNRTSVKIWKYGTHRLQTLSPNIGRAEYFEKFRNLHQSVGVHEEHSFLQKVLRGLKDDLLYKVQYTPSRGKRAGAQVEGLFLNGRRLLPAREYAELGEDEEVYRTADMNNLWTDDEINVTGIAAEGGVELKRGKKPEALIKRIVQIGSNEGDLVLDCFSGSGTTGAVAHKMGRRWVMVEAIEKLVKDSVGRLQRVVSGKDQTGISEEVKWRSGGGFRYLEVGAPLLVQDPESRLVILNPHYINSKLVRAVCQMEGFALTGDDKRFHGWNGGHLAHVTEDFVDDAYVRRLAAGLPDGHSLTIYGIKFQRGIPRPRNVSLSRMQTELVKPYLTKGTR